MSCRRMNPLAAPTVRARGAEWRAALLACALLATAGVPTASAQETAEPVAPAEADSGAAAREHFQKGVDYYTEGDLAAAMVEFQRAFKLQPTFRLLYNLGQVAYEQRDYVAAERYFRRYLAEGAAQIDQSRRHEVERELERLQGRVTDLRLRSSLPNARLFVDEQAVGTAPLSEPVRVSAGRRELRAELPGYAPVRKIVDVVGGEPLSVELAFGEPLNVVGGESKGGGTSPALWTGIATGVLALGTGGMALWANSDESSYDKALERQTTREELETLRDRTEQKALITDVLLGATVVTATITLILLLTEDGSEERAPSHARRVEVGPGSVRASF